MKGIRGRIDHPQVENGEVTCPIHEKGKLKIEGGCHCFLSKIICGGLKLHIYRKRGKVKKITWSKCGLANKSH